MKELFSFLQLYIDESHMFSNSLGVTLFMLYGNALFYIFDFYGLVKKKSKKETWHIMIIPMTVSLMGSALLGMMFYIPKPGGLEQFAFSLGSQKLNLFLLGSILLYGLLWATSLLFQRERKKEEMLRFILSCILDYVCAAMILVGSVSVLICGEESFLLRQQRILWLYLYAVYLFGCKLILFMVGLVVRLFCMKFTVFRWREGKNPSVFLFRYFAFYQNAIVRCVLLFELGILIPLTVALVLEGWNLQATGIMGFLYLCGIFVIIFSLSTCMGMLDKFRQWGDPYRLKEQFCREYFCEEPVYQDKKYTVTRHFLIDEQMPASVYYLPVVKTIGGWAYDKKGRSRTLWFSDGTSCQFLDDEADSCNQIVQYIENYHYEKQEFFDGTGEDVPKANNQKNTYDVLVKKMAFAFLYIIIIITMIIRLFPK